MPPKTHLNRLLGRLVVAAEKRRVCEQAARGHNAFDARLTPHVDRVLGDPDVAVADCRHALRMGERSRKGNPGQRRGDRRRLEARPAVNREVRRAGLDG